MGAPTNEGLELPNPDEHIPYRVLAQLPREELTAANQFVDVIEVTYEGPSGAVGKIKVPKASYNAAEVDRLIQQELLQIEGVASLGPAPHPENAAE